MRIGIDIGGSHIGIGLVDNKGKIVLKHEYEITNNEKKNIEKVIEKHIIETIDEIHIIIITLTKLNPLLFFISITFFILT